MTEAEKEGEEERGQKRRNAPGALGTLRTFWRKGVRDVGGLIAKYERAYGSSRYKAWTRPVVAVSMNAGNPTRLYPEGIIQLPGKRISCGEPSFSARDDPKRRLTTATRAPRERRD